MLNGVLSSLDRYLSRSSVYYSLSTFSAGFCSSARVFLALERPFSSSSVSVHVLAPAQALTITLKQTGSV